MKSLIGFILYLMTIYPILAQTGDAKLDSLQTLIDALETQRVEEICGVHFGASYEKAKNILENKYGRAEYDFSHSKQMITFSLKWYAGIHFDKIHFLFQNDGERTFMNGCCFIINAKDIEDVKAKRKMLHDKLSQKYQLEEHKDENGFIYYIGGISPIGLTNGLLIDVVKYEKGVSWYPYSARLLYGPYNYVTEEF